MAYSHSPVHEDALHMAGTTKELRERLGALSVRWAKAQKDGKGSEITHPLMEDMDAIRIVLRRREG